MARGMLRRRLSAGTSDQSGSAAIIFSLSVVPILLLVAAGIDYSRAVEQKSALQEATDSTALAMMRLYQTKPDGVTTAQAQTFLSGAVSDANAVITSGPTITSDSVSTGLCIRTKTTLGATMMQVAVGMGFAPPSIMTVSGYSCTKMDQTVEVALVLDTSGSMNDTVSGVAKIKSLRDAANKLISVMIPTGTTTPRAALSIVPFSLAVNVGANNRGASWIDNDGKSSIAMQNYFLPKNLPNTVTAKTPTDRFDLFDGLGISWGGCIEERSGSYLSSDDKADASVSADTLYEPYFAPDETLNDYGKKYSNYYGGPPVNSYISNQNGGLCTYSDKYSKADATTQASGLSSNTIGNSSLGRGDTQTMVCKYKAYTGTVSATPASYYSAGSGFATGPNLLCDAQALTPLTNDRALLATQVSALVAKGSTNLFSGIMWGWRTISPNGPFQTQAAGTIGYQKPEAYTTASVAVNNAKYVIMMTDGMNSWNSVGTAFGGPLGNNKSSYSPFGFYENARLGTTTASNYRSTMDAATLQACKNIKATGVKIYTIGFSTTDDPIDADGKTLLQNCATNSGMAYFAANGDSLTATFQSIAQQMSSLRLTN